MFTVTKAAAEAIQKSASQGGMEGMALRIAATKKPDGSLDYAMGFDDAGEEDLEVKTEGVAIIIAPSHVNALRGATMDFVEIEPGQHRFIFLNPNDPEYSPPTGG
jgi:iron-sulfur cluster assembly protein